MSLTIYAAVARVQKQKHVVHNVKDAARLATDAKVRQRAPLPHLCNNMQSIVGGLDNYISSVLKYLSDWQNRRSS